MSMWASPLGTLGWMERTGGRLAWHDCLALLAQGVQARLAAWRMKRIRVCNAISQMDISSVQAIPQIPGFCTQMAWYKPLPNADSDLSS